METPKKSVKNPMHHPNSDKAGAALESLEARLKRPLNSLSPSIECLEQRLKQAEQNRQKKIKKFVSHLQKQHTEKTEKVLRKRSFDAEKSGKHQERVQMRHQLAEERRLRRTEEKERRLQSHHKKIEENIRLIKEMESEEQNRKKEELNEKLTESNNKRKQILSERIWKALRHNERINMQREQVRITSIKYKQSVQQQIIQRQNAAQLKRQSNLGAVRNNAHEFLHKVKNFQNFKNYAFYSD